MNGLSSFWCQTIIRPNAGILLTRPRGQSSVRFELKYKKFLSRKWIWKCCLQNGGHFVSASMWSQHFSLDCCHFTNEYHHPPLTLLLYLGPISAVWHSVFKIVSAYICKPHYLFLSSVNLPYITKHDIHFSKTHTFETLTLVTSWYTPRCLQIQVQYDMQVLNLALTVSKYSLLMHCIKIKSRAKSLLNEQYVFVGGNISFLCVLSCISEEA